MAACVRLASETDAAGIRAIYRPVVESTAISFEIAPPDEGEMRRRIRETLPAYPWLVCECDGQIAGYAYASRFRVRSAYQWSVETSAYVDARFRRRGLGHGLYRSLLAVLAAQGYVSVYAGIALPNPESVALHERVGFTKLGVFSNVGYKLGKWHDVGWWQLALRSGDTEPAAIQPMTTMQRRPDWSALVASGLAVIRVPPD